MRAVRILNQTLAEQRKRLHLTQAQVAASVGVSRGDVARWETLRAGVPTHRLPAIADALKLDLADLRRLASNSQSGRPALLGMPGLHSRDRAMLPYPVKGTLDEMLVYGRRAERLSIEVEQILGPLAYADFLRNVPRDSALELLQAHVLLWAGRTLRIVRPLQDLGCLLPIVEKERDVYAGHRPTYGIVLSDERYTLVAVPQVTLLTRKTNQAYRCDFLGLASDGDDRCWVDVETDSHPHELTVERDQARSWGLGLIRIGFSKGRLLHDSCLEYLWESVRGALARSKSQRAA